MGYNAKLNALLDLMLDDARSACMEGGCKACLSALEVYADRIRQLAKEEAYRDLFK